MKKLLIAFLLTFKIEEIQTLQIGILDNITLIEDFMEQMNVLMSRPQLRESFVEIIMAASVLVTMT